MIQQITLLLKLLIGSLLIKAKARVETVKSRVRHFTEAEQNLMSLGGTTQMAILNTNTNSSTMASNTNSLVPETSVAISEGLSLFNYAGSKKKFSKQFNGIHDYIFNQEDISSKVYVNTYIEAFAGSLASLVHNTQNIIASQYVINDLNGKLINIY